MKILSIIIPIYNTEITLLKKCFFSIINNNFYDKRKVEIIIINDNSNNQITNFLVNTSKENNFKYIKNKQNLGASISRNKGIQRATGKWLAFVDGDDIIGNNYFKYILDNIEDKINILIFKTSERLYWITNCVIVKKEYLVKNAINYNNTISSYNNIYEDLHFFIKIITITDEYKIIELDNYKDFYVYNYEYQINTKSVANRDKKIFIRYVQIIDAIELVNKYSRNKICFLFQNEKNKMLRLNSLKKIFNKYDHQEKYYKKIKILKLPRITYNLMNINIIFKKILYFLCKIV